MTLAGQNIRFDWTISFGNIVHILILLCAMILAWAKMDARLTATEETLREHVNTVQAMQREIEIVSRNQARVIQTLEDSGKQLRTENPESGR